METSSHSLSRPITKFIKFFILTSRWENNPNVLIIQLPINPNCHTSLSDSQRRLMRCHVNQHQGTINQDYINIFQLSEHLPCTSPLLHIRVFSRLLSFKAEFHSGSFIISTHYLDYCLFTLFFKIQRLTRHMLFQRYPKHCQ